MNIPMYDPATGKCIGSTEVPDEIIEMARKVEQYFKSQDVAHWTLNGIQSRRMDGTI